VFLFVPNLIGYSRVILAAISLFFMPIHPKFCTVLYTISCLLDAVDGQAARALGQASKFGAVLDMVTDRWVGRDASHPTRLDTRLGKCDCADSSYSLGAPPRA
jgi:hypothetical protein